MILGAHVIVYSQDAEADRAFLRDVLGFPHVDAGGGWLIFALPAAEVAMHPADESEAGNDGRHELYLVCDDVATQAAALRVRGVACTEPVDQGWGVLATITLPGGGALGIYEPRHPTALAFAVRARPKPKPKRKPKPKPSRARSRATRPTRATSGAASRPRGSRPPAKRR